jgi:hypothetical protein
LGSRRASAEVIELPTARAKRRKSTGAAREALRRQRERLGIRVYSIEVFDDAIEAMIDRGEISEFDAQDKALVSRALARLIDGFLRSSAP